jgi:hypothetical protein
MHMLENVLIVVVGVIFIVWNKWLTRYMYSVKLRAASKENVVRERVELLEGMLQKTSEGWVTKTLPLLGFAMVLYGGISLVFS